MPFPTHAEHSSAQPPDPGAVDSLISQARLLRTQVDAVLQDSATAAEDPQLRWQRALCDLAVHQLDDVDTHLGQLRDGLGAETPADAADPLTAELLVDLPAQPSVPPEPAAVSALGRAGSAEWDLLTDDAQWSDELYRMFGRTPNDGPLTLDELPSWLFSEDQHLLTEMVTGCLVDGRPIDGEFRIVRADGSVRTVHMVGEPVLGDDGDTVSMWAVLRDVSDLRRSQRTLRETRDSLQRQRQIAQTERRLAVELQEAVLPPWRGTLRFPQDGGPTTMDLAAHYLPSGTSALIGGDLVRRDAVARRVLLTDSRRHDRTRCGRHLGHGDAAGRAARHGRRGPPAGPADGLAQRTAGHLRTARPRQRPVLPVRAVDPHAAVGAGRAPRPAAVPRRSGASAGVSRRRPARGDLRRPVRAGRRATGRR